MPIKYIKQIINQDFVYPNNEVSEYDAQIVHDINENSVSGSVISLSFVSGSTSGLTFALNASWAKNNAEPFIKNSAIGVWSVHMLAPNQNYYKPWRMVSNRTTMPTTLTAYTVNYTFQVTPAQMGLTSFTNGTYYFEVRFIGHRSVYPVSTSVVVSTIGPTPTPTPTVTPTPTSPGPTPTPTPTVTVTPTPTSSYGILYVSTNRDVCSDFCTTNYLVTQQVSTTAASYAALVPGDYIYGLVAGTYWYAYASSSTSTGSGVFRIAQVDSSGYVLSIAECGGSSCNIL